jgi:hypothetical protein
MAGLVASRGRVFSGCFPHEKIRRQFPARRQRDGPDS